MITKTQITGLPIVKPRKCSVWAQDLQFQLLPSPQKEDVNTIRDKTRDRNLPARV
jgi:hypothetical protein